MRKYKCLNSLFLHPVLPTLLLAVGLASCVDQILLPEPEEELPPLVIQGSIENSDHSRIWVSVARAAYYSDSSFQEPLAADVLVRDDTGNEIQVPQLPTGEYELLIPPGASFPVESGRSYQLEVRTGNRIYLSAFDPLLPVPQPDSISYRVETRQEFNDNINPIEQQYIGFSLHSPLIAAGETEPVALRWQFMGAWRLEETLPPGIPVRRKTCYIESPMNLEEIIVLNGRETDQGRLNGYFLFEEKLDNRYYYPYYLTVLQYSLSQEAYDYWSQTSEIVERTGGLFEAPPAPVAGNISNPEDAGEEVRGFFFATSVDTLRQRIVADGVRAPVCPSNGNPGQDLPSYCFECTEWTGSSLQKPHYWED